MTLASTASASATDTSPDATAGAAGSAAAADTFAAPAAATLNRPTSTPTPASPASLVLDTPPLAPFEAAAWFGQALRHSTDASDVLADLRAGVTSIIVIDARSAELYAQKHIPGAISLPHRTIGPETLALLPRDKVIVTYCDGIGCNGSTRAALKLARLGYQVKELIGGLAFWEYEGYPVESGAGPAAALCIVDGSDPGCGC